MSERFVGRAEELATLTTLLDRAAAGQGSLLLLAGEPGIGKTRLVEELADLAAGRGFQVLWGGCWEGEGAPAFRPWVEALRSLLQATPPEVLAAELGAEAGYLVHLLPELRPELATLPALPVLEPEEARFQLFDAVLGWLRSAGSRAPLLLVLDDLHWADMPSLLLLQVIARQLPALPLLLVVTYRDVELDRRHPLAAVLPALRRLRGCQRLLLRSLDEPAVQALVEALLEQSSSERGVQFAAALQQETEGNPFFVREVVRHLQESGRLVRREGRWTSEVQSVAELELPEGIREVIGRRLSRLPEATNRVLGAAAVLGREFAYRLLAAVSELEEEALLGAVEAALEARVLEEVRGVSEATYRFPHALLRQTLSEELSLPRKQRLHRRAAEAIEHLFGTESAAHLAELASHSLQAVPEIEPARASDAALRAAGNARATFAFEEAVRWYAAALEVLDLAAPDDEVRRFAVLMGLAEAQYRSGERRTALPSVRVALVIAQRTGDPLRLAQAALLLSRIEGLHAPQGAVASNMLLQAAIEAVGESDATLAASLRGMLAIRLLFHAPPNADHARDIATEAVVIARQGQSPAYGFALASWAFTHFDPGSIDELEMALSDLDLLSQQAPDQGVVMVNVAAHLAVALDRGPRSRVQRCLANFDAVLTGRYAHAHQSYGQVLDAQQAALDGRFDDLEQLVATMAVDQDHAGLGDISLLRSFYLHLLRREQGCLAELIEPLEAVRREQPGEPTMQARLALAYSEAGRLEDARRELETFAASGYADIIKRVWLWPGDLSYLSEVAVRLGAGDHATALYAALRPYAGHAAITGLHPYLGVFDRYLGLLATALGRFDDAEQHFTRAQTLHEALQTPPWIAHTQHDWASMLLARGRPEDRGRATALLAEALATARRLGMLRLTRQLETLSAKRMDATPPRPVYPDGLSEREVEVLRRLAAGRSNREIAAALVISAHTVAFHVTNIFNKTGTANRTEAAAYAYRHQLASQAD